MEKGETKVHFKLYKAGRQWLVASIAIVGLGIATSPLFIKQSADTQTVYAASQDEQDMGTPGPDEVGLNQQAALDTVEVSSPEGQNVKPSVVSNSAKVTDQQGKTLIDQPQPVTVNDTAVGDSDATAAVDSNDVNSNPTPTTEVPAADATDQSTVVTVEGQRLDDLKNSFTYHTSTPNPAAGIKDDGQVVLTADAGRQSGNLTLNNQIDLAYDFDLTGTITIGTGDGVAIGFHTGNTDEVGRNGGALGFAGLGNAFGWKADTYNNSNGGQNDNDTTVINGQKVPYFGPDPQGYRRFGAFAHTGDNGITIETNGASAQSIDPSFDTIHVHYEAAAQLLTIELSQSSRPGAILKWTENIEHEIPKNRLVSFFIAGSNGDAHSKQGFKLNRFTYNAVGVAHVEYRDEAGALLLKGDDIHGIIGRTVTVLGTPEYQRAIAFLKTPEQGGYVPVNINDQGNVTFQRTHPETLTITMKKQYEATIHFVDDAENTQQADLGAKQITWTDGAPLEHMDDVNRQLTRLMQAGYQLVEDTRPNDGAYAPGANYTLHFIHQTKVIAQPQVTRTITYQGLPADKAIAPVTQTATYEVTKDLVTDAEFDATFTLPEVVTPSVTGYTADASVVSAFTSTTGGQPTDVVVTYTAQPQPITINFVDRDTQTTLKTLVLTRDNGVVSFDQVLGQAPIGYRVDLSTNDWDQATNTYTIGLYNVQALEDNFHQAVDDFTNAIKTAITFKIVDRDSQATLKTFLIPRNENGIVPFDKVMAQIPAGYRLDLTANAWDPGTNTYTLSLYNVQALEDKVKQTVADFTNAIKTAITFKLVDPDTNVTLKTFLIPRNGNGIVPFDKVVAQIPAGYRLDLTANAWDPDTNTYTLGLYNVQTLEDKVKQTVADFTNAIKTAITFKLVDRDSQASLKTFLIPRNERGIVPFDKVVAQIPAGYRLDLTTNAWDPDTNTYTLGLYNVQTLEDKVSQAVADFTNAIKTAITFKFVDRDTNTTLKTLLIPRNEAGIVPVDKVLAQIPAGYRMAFTTNDWDQATNTYTISLYNVQTLEDKVNQAVADFTNAIKTAITFKFVDRDTNVTLKTFLIPRNENGIVPFDKVLAQIPAGYRLDLTTNAWNQATNTYTLSLYNVQALEEKLNQTISDFKQAIKTAITFKLVDRDSQATLKTFLIPRNENGIVPFDKVLAQIPAGYRMALAFNAWDQATNTYTIVIYNVKTDGKKANPNKGQPGGAISAVTKTIEVNLIDGTTGAVIQHLSYVIGINSRLPMAKVKATLPTGYRIDQARSWRDPQTGTYNLVLVKVIDSRKLAQSTLNGAVKVTESPALVDTSAALPATGDRDNATASAVGLVAVIGALFGLAGTLARKRE